MYSVVTQWLVLRRACIRPWLRLFCPILEDTSVSFKVFFLYSGLNEEKEKRFVVCSFVTDEKPEDMEAEEGEREVDAREPEEESTVPHDEQTNGNEEEEEEVPRNEDNKEGNGGDEEESPQVTYVCLKYNSTLLISIHFPFRRFCRVSC